MILPYKSARVHGSNKRPHAREYTVPLFYVVSPQPHLSLVIWIPHPIQERNLLALHILVYQQDENKTARWQSPRLIQQSYCWFSWQKYSSLGSEDLQTSRAQSCKNKNQWFYEWIIRQMKDRELSAFPFLISRPMYSGYGRNKLVTCKVRTNLLSALKAPPTGCSSYRGSSYWSTCIKIKNSSESNLKITALGGL